MKGLISSLALQTLFVVGSARAALVTSPASALVDTSEMSKAAAAAAQAQAAAGSQQLLTLVTQHKQLKTALSAEQQGLKQHETKASAAFARFQAALKSGQVSPGALTELDTGRSEYAAANMLGAQLSQHITALRALELRIQKQLDANQQSATDAKRAADAGSAATLQLSALAKAANASAELAARQSATAASSALRVSQVPSKKYEAFQAKAAKDDAALKQRLSTVQAALNTVQPPPLSQCDLRYVDWKNFGYSEFPELKDGGASQQTSDGATEAYQVDTVEFFDLDGDGAVEALVHGMYSHLAQTAYQRPYLFVLARDKACNAYEAGSAQGTGMCSELGRDGRKVVVSGCGDDPVEYQLLGGELKVTKGTPQN